jgi:hypothetical protein
MAVACMSWPRTLYHIPDGIPAGRSGYNEPVMSLIYLVEVGGDLGRRRGLLPPGSFVEAWPDLEGSGRVWIGEEARKLLDTVGPPLAAVLAIPATAVPIYYGPALSDLGSLPTEESIRTRVLSARGIAAAWVAPEASGLPASPPGSPDDPVFFLRRPGGSTAHRWRLFRTRQEAIDLMRRLHEDPEAAAWAEAIAVEDYAALIARHRPPRAEPDG